MAQHQQLPPELLAVLKSETAIVKQAKNSTSDFKTFAGPPGNYFARLQRLSLTKNKTSGKIQINHFLTALVKCPDSQSNNNIGDTEFAGSAMKFTNYTHQSENSSAQEAWERAMQSLQAYDVRTDMFGMRSDENGTQQFNNELWYVDMWEAICLLNDRQPPVSVTVKETPGKGKNTGKIFKNINVNETLTEEAVARWAAPKLQISDEQMADDSNNLSSAEEIADSKASSSWPFSPEEADQIIIGCGDSLADNVKAMVADFGIAIPPDLLQAMNTLHLEGWPNLVDKMSSSELQEFAKAGLSNHRFPHPQSISWVVDELNRLSNLEKERQQPSKPSSGTSSTDSVQSSSASGSGPFSAHGGSNGKTDSSSSEQGKSGENFISRENQSTFSTDELDELAEESPAPQSSPLLSAQLEASLLDRLGLKKAILALGGPAPDEKFSTSQTDEFLREWFVGLKVGTIAPKRTKAQSPPFEA